MGKGVEMVTETARYSATRAFIVAGHMGVALSITFGLRRSHLANGQIPVHVQSYLGDTIVVCE